MRNRIVVVSFLLGAASAGGIALLVQSASSDVPMRQAGDRVGGPPVDRQLPADTAADQLRRWAAISLDRPLFWTDRRPFAKTAGGPDGMAGLPRLSGIMITPAGRHAIFAAIGGGKPEVVAEGDSVGRYLVQSISIGQVVLIGPDGRHNLHLPFDGTRLAAPHAPPIVPGSDVAKAAMPSETNP
jgi:hypothetical protein